MDFQRDPDALVAVGDRVYSHYVGDWGTVIRVAVPRAEQMRAGEPTGEFTTWWTIHFDKGERTNLDDADGAWEWARFMPPHVAERYGYGKDPQA